MSEEDRARWNGRYAGDLTLQLWREGRIRGRTQSQLLARRPPLAG